MKKGTPIYLSVVLSTYNDEKYIAEAIQSILSQTYPYFEFIIVNDGSIDNTLSIIKSFNDERIVLIDKPNTGLIDSLNLGVRTAKYDWIARMDGDDIALPTRFEEEVKLITNDVCVISSQCEFINGEGVFIGRSYFLTGSLGIWLSNILCLPLIVHPATLYSKQVFEQVGGYDKNMYVAEDYDLWCKMITISKVKIARKCLLKLRKHGDNISTTRGDDQRLNGFIGYVKYLCGINRCLSDEEYSILREGISRSNLYKYSIVFHGKILYLLYRLYCVFCVKCVRCYRTLIKKVLY